MSRPWVVDRIRKSAPNVTVADWLDSWDAFFADERSEATAEHDEHMLEPFARAHPGLLLSEVTPLMAQEWATANPAQVRYLRFVFDRAVGLMMLEVNPWRLVQMPRKEGPPKAPPSLQELEAACDRARARGGWWLEFADLLEFTAFSGARAGGVAALRVCDVDPLAKRAVLIEKGAKQRTVVLTVRALQAVGRQLARRESGTPREAVLWTTVRGRPLDRNSLGEAWREVRGEFPGGFHTLRHFAGTWLAEAGVDERDIAVQLGHFDGAGRPYTRLVRRVYVHPSHEAALARIETAVS